MAVNLNKEIKTETFSGNKIKINSIFAFLALFSQKIIDSVTSRNKNEWIPIIKSTYPENVPFPISKIVICDLHFDASDIITLGSKKHLTIDAVPKVR